MADIAKTTRIESIIDFALEDLSTWKAPQSLKSIGPVYPEAYKQFQDALDAFKVDLRTHLGFLTAAELEGDFPQTTTGALNMLFDPDGQVGFLARRLVRLKKTVPADYIGGWAIKGMAIDQAHWRGMSHFTLSEATMLSMGRDPRKTSYGPVMRHYGRSPQENTILYFLEARYEAIANGLGLDAADEHCTVDADTFYGWIEAFSVSVDERFRRMMNDRCKRLAQNAPKVVEQGAAGGLVKDQRLHGSSRRVHARIVVAMARTKYGLKDSEGIGKVVKAIASDADFAGLGVDSKVIRQLLKTGLDDLKSQT
jgi:hypothetical protein